MLQLRTGFADASPTQTAQAFSIINQSQSTPTWATKLVSTWSSPLYTVFRTVAMATSAFHGYRRNRSVGWSIWWGLMGGIFPVITPTIALAQGFGKAK